MCEITHLLENVASGDQQAAADLLPLVYVELRELAAAKMAAEAQGHTLQATALVHEAYLRLVGSADPGWHGRGHFFAAAAEAMRRILVESARRKRSRKRGGDVARLDFDPALIAAPGRPDDILALDESLGRLEALAPKQAALVKLRYFAGMTIPQAAEALDIAPRTADAYWSYARAWLLADLRDEPE
jgi:RNA polymerase sigma factor (TIGR02999 family)